MKKCNYQEKFLKEIAMISMDAEEKSINRPQIHPVFKLIFVLCVLVTLAVSSSYVIFAIITFLYICLVILNFGQIRKIYSIRLWWIILVTAILMLPAMMNIFHSGQPYILYYHLAIKNNDIYITKEGMHWFLKFMCRFSLMVLLAQFFRFWIRSSEFISGLHQLHIPYFVIYILMNAIKNIHSMLGTAKNMYLARMSRLFNPEMISMHYSWSSSVLALLLKKSLQNAEEASYGMKSRFAGKFPGFAEHHFSLNDYLWLFIAVSLLIMSVIRIGV